VTRTLAPGGSYAFSELFLPSTLGTVGLLACAVAFVAGRPLVSGICLALAGLFHVNYLVLGLCVFGVAWLLSGRERLGIRALAGLGPAVLVLLGFLPFLLASASPGVSAEAQRIFQDVRSPHHYCVSIFAWDFSFWAGFQALGVAALLGPAQRGSVVHQRLLKLLVGWCGLVVLAALLSSVVVVRSVSQLFAWRICAEAELLAQVAFAAALLGMYCDGRKAFENFAQSETILGAIGLAALVLGSVVTGKWNTTLVVLSLCAVAFAIVRGLPRGLMGPPAQGGLPLARVTGALLTTLVAVNVARFSRLVHYSNLLSGGDKSTTELCDWVQAHTREDALLLTPPHEDELRFLCRRAIVVDWKTAPVMPAEILTWFERIQDVTGRRPFRTEADLAGYDKLDPARVALLRQRYGIDYVVVEHGHELDLGVRPAFSGARFAVYPLNRASAR